MNSEVSPAGQFDLVLEDRCRVPGVEVLGEGIHLRLGEPKCLADVLENRAGPVGDDVGHHRRPFSARTGGSSTG